MEEWISINDKLPEKQYAEYSFTPDCTVKLADGSICPKAYYHYLDMKWYSLVHPHPYKPIIGVTHWNYVPQPPKQ